MIDKISVKDLLFSYDNSENVIKNVNYTFSSKTIQTLIGPNGSGKSTLLSLLLGFYKSQQGSVYYDETNLVDISLNKRASLVSYVPQHSSYESNFTVREIVTMGMFANNSQRIVIDRVLNELGLLKLKDKPLYVLSGGQVKLVYIARAIAQDTPFIVMDEPTTNLDLYFQHLIYELLKSISKDKGIILSLHDLSMASEISNALLLIDKGRLVVSGDSFDVLSDENIRTYFNISAQLRRIESNNLLIKAIIE